LFNANSRVSIIIVMINTFPGTSVKKKMFLWLFQRIFLMKILRFLLKMRYPKQTIFHFPLILPKLNYWFRWMLSLVFFLPKHSIWLVTLITWKSSSYLTVERLIISFTIAFLKKSIYIFMFSTLFKSWLWMVVPWNVGGIVKMCTYKSMSIKLNLTFLPFTRVVVTLFLVFNGYALLAP